MALIDPQQMGTLGKIGFVLQSAANPEFANTYLQNLEAQRQNQRIIATREEELAQRQADRAEEIRIRRLQEQRQAQELARQDALRQAQAGLFAQPNVLGQLSQMTGLSPESITPFIQSGGDVSVLGQIQKLQQPIQPELPAGVDLPEGYMPQFDSSGRLIGAQKISGIEQKPQDIQLEQVYDPASGNMVFVPKQQAIGRISKAPETPKSKVTGEMAGKVTLAENFLKNIPQIQADLVESINPIDFSLEKGDTGRAKRALREAIGAALYIKTGAAATPKEIEEQESLYLPTPIDSQATRQQKVNLLKDFLGGAVRTIKGDEVSAKEKVIDFSELPK